MPGSIKSMKKKPKIAVEQAVGGAGAKPHAAAMFAAQGSRNSHRGMEANTARSKGSPAPDHRSPASPTSPQTKFGGLLVEESR